MFFFGKICGNEKKNILKFVKYVFVVRFNLNVLDDKIMDVICKINVDKYIVFYS